MSLKKSLKRIGRKVQAAGAKIVKYATPVLSTAATFIGGPLAGAAVTGMGSAAVRGMAATGARAKGLKGKEAKAKGRKEMQKTLKMGLAGTAAGMAGAGIYSLVSGGNVLGGLLGGAANIFGIGGGSSAAAESIVSGEPQTLPPGAGTGSYTGDYYSGQGTDVTGKLLGLGGEIAKGLLTPEQQKQLQQQQERERQEREGGGGNVLGIPTKTLVIIGAALGGVWLLSQSGGGGARAKAA
jgi:hypothetical protein